MEDDEDWFPIAFGKNDDMVPLVDGGNQHDRREIAKLLRVSEEDEIKVVKRSRFIRNR